MNEIEKQAVEEMAKDIGIAFQLSGTTRFGAVAEILVEQGYKNCKDKVVLSKEEWARLRNLEINYDDTYEHYREYSNENKKLKAENERLKEQNGALSCDLDYANEVDDYKDRIIELEKENETKTDTITDLLKKQEFYEKEKLKQFAERLKEKMGVREYMGVKYKQGVFSENEIDETLKEFEL